MRILVTGATGLIGSVLCDRLEAEGHQLVILTRRPSGSGKRESHSWLPEQELPPREAVEGTDAVIHLAGEPVAAGRWAPEQKRRIRDSRVIGTRNLIAGIERVANRPRILVSGSAVGFYGNRGDEVLPENAPAGKGYLPEVCVAWEKEASRGEALGMRVTQIRIGVVLASDGGAMEKMLTPFKLGLGGALGSGRQWFPWIHLDDIVGILRHALLTEGLHGPVNGVAPGIVRNEEFTRELAVALHRPAIFAVPEFALRIMMGEMADVVLASQRVVPGVAQEGGYEFRHPDLRSALRAMFERP